jgi:hypothetical protein
MNKIKAICINNIIREHPLDDYTKGPFTIGKVYELDIYGNGKWCLVFHDEERIGHYPMSLFKTLEDHREEILNELL